MRIGNPDYSSAAATGSRSSGSPMRRNGGLRSLHIQVVELTADGPFRIESTQQQVASVTVGRSLPWP